VAYIAENSVRRVADGWTWLFDPAAFRQLRPASLFGQLVEVTCPLALVRGEESRILDRETAEQMCDQFGGTCVLIDIPQAHHHVMIDQPLALVSVIRTLLAGWSLSPAG
jgi:pimeloyl-ACP methyl ester carboxylesterase